jgi:hypothetical protein
MRYGGDILKLSVENTLVHWPANQIQSAVEVNQQFFEFPSSPFNAFPD